MEKSQATEFIHSSLALMVKRGGSDLFISAGFPPAIKVDGNVEKLSVHPLTPEHTQALAVAVMNDKQRRDFEANKAVNFAISPTGIGRFRANAFTQRGSVALVARKIPLEIPTIDGLQLPGVLKELAMTKRGLIIFVGATGSGKSTSLAGMVDWRNENSQGHIITIEDPIEFLHPHKNCIVNQREVGIDSIGWEDALKDTLRQAPDVILMGEIRDRETMDQAVAFAETGHLALATLHANNANQAIDRIINFFPEERRTQLLMDLSLNLKAIVSQRLIRLEQGKGRVAAVEVMINSPLIAEKVLNGEVGDIKDVMKKSRELGMQTFDQALFDLFESGRIGYEDALRNADSMNDLRLTIKLHGKRQTAEVETGHLSII
ncbi:MAG: PilT/PilU family type 4a pilus ATPase [Betaproteobacteria bacterium]|jgi:twitching motility protein PilU|nr:PilT/PilU family type 4a pilus ATPase [Betaproteobacteria bacterium]MBU6512868.1 PilT/PilU family type 4a pilus ATPase [Betaproteobacteria bacterium]MDE2154110.1 PilT/PilU family type 4a pilus ATPase [Betaproteobacteria bacterium]MDE2477340.1 PilT/PilU family type 4a pilus ATPase [Betaproteobacteria bacterium]